MNVEQAKELILYVVKKTEPRWRQYLESYSDINEIFIRRGYEQGGFEFSKFSPLLHKKGIFSIEKIGSILDRYDGSRRYDRDFAGSLDSMFYSELRQREYREEGLLFVQCVSDFLESKCGRAGAFFWEKLWQMLICCNFLKKEFNASFSYYFKKKYSEFRNVSNVSDEDLFHIKIEEWEDFKRHKKPWRDLYGIGENIFDYIIGDIKEFDFAQDSYKFDSANRYFFEVTGLSNLLRNFTRNEVIKFLKSLNLKYSLREINKGIYTYCSISESKNFGFCRNTTKCKKCEVNGICEKNLIANANKSGTSLTLDEYMG